MIISGRMTGDAPDLAKVRAARAMAGSTPILLGSGTDERNIAAFMEVADGAIVGSSIKADGEIANPVDAVRVRRFVAAAAGR
jgi:predicted TIM-barrel enzyme